MFRTGIEQRFKKFQHWSDYNLYGMNILKFSWDHAYAISLCDAPATRNVGYSWEHRHCSLRIASHYDSQRHGEGGSLAFTYRRQARGRRGASVRLYAEGRDCEEKPLRLLVMTAR